MNLSEKSKEALKRLKQKKIEPTILTPRQKRIMEAFGIPLPPIFSNISELLKGK